MKTEMNFICAENLSLTQKYIYKSSKMDSDYYSLVKTLLHLLRIIHNYYVNTVYPIQSQILSNYDLFFSGGSSQRQSSTDLGKLLKRTVYF